jgi:sec-independent protein translocase protein TatC
MADETLENRLPFMTHLEELRKRLVRCLIALAIGFGVCYNYAGPILDFLKAPVIDALAKLPGDQAHLVFTGVSELFFTYLKVAFIASLFLTLPYVLWQVWGFISPGLFRKERRIFAGMVVTSTLLFLAGASFCYWVVFPAAFGFFLSSTFVSETIQPFLSIKEYLSFITRFLLAFGLIFQMPLLSFFFTRLGVVNHKALGRFRRYAIVINFIIAAILTPTPDIMNQLLMAGPLIVLYEVSILVSRLSGGKPEKEEVPP